MRSASLRRRLLAALAGLALLPAVGPLRAQAPVTEPIAGTLVSLELVPVPAGRARTAAGEVAVGPFLMTRIEVPWDVYDVWAFGLDQGGQLGTGKNEDAVSRPSAPYMLPGESFGHNGLPALGMHFLAAEKFAEWLSAKTGKRYRVPTEAEWEHACRAGSPAPASLAEHAWFRANSGERTHAGGARPANAFGLHDMLGNVAEWVVGADGEPVVKGGSWQDEAADVSCGARRSRTPEWNMTDPQLPKSRWWLSDAPFVGLRLVREP